MDSDDFVTSELFEKIYDLIKKYDNTELFCFTNNIVSENGKLKKLGISDSNLVYCNSIYDLSNAALGTRNFNGGVVWSKLYKKTIIENKEFNTNLKYAEDSVFNLTLNLTQKIICFQLPFYNYRINKHSASHSYDPNADKSFANTIQTLLDIYSKQNKENHIYALYECSIFCFYLDYVLNKQVFNKENKMSNREKKIQASNILNSNIYKLMFESIDVNKLNFKNKLKYKLLKSGRIKLCFRLNNVLAKLKGEQ